MSRRKAISFRQRDVSRPPEGVPWVWYTVEMLNAPAFRTLSLSGRRFISLLEVHLMNSAGLENGLLTATWTQCQAAGIHKDAVTRTIADVVKRGLVEVTQRGLYRGHGKGMPNRFRLTFRQTRSKDEFGREEWFRATDEWKLYREPASTPGKQVIVPAVRTLRVKL
jgi:hypothetical protein